MDVETYTSNQVIDNLYVGANETYNSGIIEDSRTINGTVYTKALILNKNDLGNINSKDNNSANKYGCLFVKLPDGPGTVKLTYYNNGSAGDIAYCFSKYSSTQRSYSGISTNGYGVLEVPYSDSDSRYLYLYLHGNYITQIYLYKIEVVPQVTKTISSAGWATYCSPYALDFTNAIDNLEAAYMVTGGDNSVVTLSGITGTIPANTGILLKGEGECAIPVVASSATNVDENKLVGVTANTEIAAGAGYVLLNGDSGIGFYKNPDAAFTVGANTAYLPADFDGTGAREFFLLFGNETTGIGATLNEKADMRNDQLFYNLNGQRVAQPSKGLYIVGGKKVIVK